MLFNENTRQDDRDDHSAQQEQGKATGYRTDDDNDTKEKDLKRNPLFGAGTMKKVNAPGMEGQPMGGHNFGEEGKATPTGDDKDNPSRNAGYTNAYFSRTKPLEEDTANNNFKAAGQQGEPDYDKAQPNVPGPQEVPDQQKVGEESNQEQQGENPSQEAEQKPSEQEHIET